MVERFSNKITSMRSREYKSRRHWWRAKFLLVPTVVVNAVLAYVMLHGLLAMGTRQNTLASTYAAQALVCRWVAKRIRARRSMHRLLAAGYAQPSAEEVLDVIKHKGRQYALYLRGFELEQRDIIYNGVNVDVGSREAEIYARPIEALLIEMLREDVPLIALHNPRVSGPMEGAYRFEFVPADWKPFVSELLYSATLVVLYLSSLSEGILYEIELLKHPSCLGKTVIIVGRNLAYESGSGARWFQGMLHKFDRVVFEQSVSVWSRQQEEQFHSRLLACLQEMERTNQSGESVTRPGVMNFTLATLSWPTRLWDFMKGPMLGSLCFLAVSLFHFSLWLVEMTSVETNVGSTSMSWTSVDFLGPVVVLVALFVLMWVILSVALGVLKQLDFVADSVFKAIFRRVVNLFR
jgi:hypothetical protein